LVPLPQTLARFKGHFRLVPGTRIIVNEISQTTGAYLAEWFRRATGNECPVTLGDHDGAQAPKNSILLTTEGAAPALTEEGYELRVTPDSVLIRSPASTGLFYGVQTLFQLLPPEVFALKPSLNMAWMIPCLLIQDKPHFYWRGFMLDVSRHFFTKMEIKKLLDVMAVHKLNTFHWHLTDDQGWRIEIRNFPRLTNIAAWRKSIGYGLDSKSSNADGPDGRYGGYYSQEDIREIVAYAQDRHIMIVPEVEMPGHSTAALSAYPELGCTCCSVEQQVQPPRDTPDIYCAGNDQGYDFLEKVLTELCKLFPSKFIHIGGDEVSKWTWKDCPLCQARMRQLGLRSELDLQSYFISRIGAFLSAKGRRLIGWSEILEGGLAPNSVLMDWIGGAAEAARAGHDVVMSPNSHCYFDYYQSRDRSREPPASGAYLPPQTVYSFNPFPHHLDPQYHAHILGAQANLWTEYIPSFKQVEYMTFPRLCALAEVVWSGPAGRRWGEFRPRLGGHLERLKELGVTFRKDSC